MQRFTPRPTRFLGCAPFLLLWKQVPRWERQPGGRLTLVLTGQSSAALPAPRYSGLCRWASVMGQPLQALLGPVGWTVVVGGVLAAPCSCPPHKGRCVLPLDLSPQQGSTPGLRLSRARCLDPTWPEPAFVPPPCSPVLGGGWDSWASGSKQLVAFVRRA